jgi:transcriptional regulator of acetoin/glycerol metabolism
VTAALSVIRDGLGAEEGPAALYRLAARDRVVVDRAGYLHFEDAQVPPAVLERAENEADRVLSIEALRAQEVQDAQVRPIIAWLDAKGAGAAALVSDDAVPVGLLLWPAAGRVSPLAIEEVLALRSLADHLGVATGAEAELARSRARVLEAERGLGCQAGELRDLEAQLARVSYRQRAMSDLLARRVRQAAYSPAAQLALAAAERLGEQGKPIALVAPLGVDVVAWAAVVHLASPRADELMLVVDATRASEQELGGWADSKRSPLENARGGTLVILDAHVLPKDVQRLIGTSLRDDTGAIAVLPRAATAQGAPCDLDEHFTDRLGDRVLEPPGLAARVEDLRALALVALARLGMRLRGRPFGLSLEAQNLLIEHDWPANDAELEAVLVRAALATTGDVVQVEAIRRSLGAASPSAVESGPVRVAGAR